MNCPVSVQPVPHEYRIAQTTLPRVLCLGDSVSLPSCRAAASHPLVSGLLEMRSIEFVTDRGRRVKQLNSMGAANLLRCLNQWLPGRCKPGARCPVTKALRWRAAVFGAGAWDLSTGAGACCAVSDTRMHQLVTNVRRSVELALQFADVVVWVTTAPAPEHVGCCNVPRYNYSGQQHVHGVPGTIGFCNGDSIWQNRRVSEVLRATFPQERVAIADTATAVSEACGPHYTDCRIQPQYSQEGRPVTCNVHYAGVETVHGPVVARTLARVLSLNQSSPGRPERGPAGTVASSTTTSAPGRRAMASLGELRRPMVAWSHAQPPWR